MHKGLHDLQRAVESFLGKKSVSVCFLRKAQRFLLVEDHVVRAALIYVADDKTGRVGADVDDRDSLHSVPVPSVCISGSFPVIDNHYSF